MMNAKEASLLLDSHQFLLKIQSGKGFDRLSISDVDQLITKTASALKGFPEKKYDGIKN